jgi:guanylate kinase
LNQGGAGLVFVVCGPSGAGKTTLLDTLLAGDPSLTFSVSMTTREQRDGEVDKQDYYFVSEERFSQAVQGDELIEWAWVHEHRYGTPRTEISRAHAEGRDVVLDIDVQGADRLRAAGLVARYVFILPPSIDELERRLAARESETARSFATRLAAAQRELLQWPRFDYAVVNDEQDGAEDRLRAIIAAERCRVRGGWRPFGWHGDPAEA